MRSDFSNHALEFLAQAARSDRLLLFVGSGICADSGLPTWRELAEALKNEDPDFTDLPGEFSKFVERYGARELGELLDRKLGKRPTTVAEPIELLLETRSVAIVSTNCDRIIETAAHNLGVPLHVFSDDSHLTDFHSTPALRLVKLHGDLDSKDSLTFTREQYASLEDRNPALIRTVVELLNSSRVLFLGFSMADPDFHQLMALMGHGHPDRASQMVGLFSRGELKVPWRRAVVDDRVRAHAPLLELAYEDFGDSPSSGLTNFLKQLKELVSPSSLPTLDRRSIVFTHGYTATLKTEATAYLANCLGVPLLATHRYGPCTTDGVLDPQLRGSRYEELMADARSLLEREHSVVLDGTFANPAWRERVYELAADFDASVIVLQTRCDDESYIRARLWRRRLDHSRSEHEVTKYENFRITYKAVMQSPVQEDPGFRKLSAEAVTFENHADRAVHVDDPCSSEAQVIADLLRMSPLMSVEI